jgi:hypothetical protein
VNLIAGKLAEMLEDKAALMDRIQRMETDIAAVNRYSTI